jgi:O-Antigen ligase
LDRLALLPALVSLYLLMKHKPERAFLSVYLPVLLLLPEFRCVLPGVPDPTFSEAAIFPIGVVFLWRSRFKWRVSVMDYIVTGFLGVAVLSEMVNKGYNEAQNLSFDMFAWGFLPYLLGKELIEPTGSRLQFARRFVVLLFVVCAFSVYEFRFGQNPYHLVFASAFPEPRSWVTQLRWGFARIAGPFGLSIPASVIFMTGFLINHWLISSGNWDRRASWIPGLPLSKGTTLGVGLVGGVLMTMARGPWIASVFAFATAAIGVARNPRRALLIGGAFIVGAGIAGLSYTMAYSSVGRANAATEEQETAAYRSELMVKYREIALARPWLGWGRLGWPKVPGMASIDNEYLLLALMHGFICLALFFVMLGLSLIRLLGAAIQDGLDPQQRSLLFALAGVIVAIAVSLGTVFMGNQLFPVVFLMTGWAEGCVLERSGMNCMDAPVLQTPRYQFQQVYA